MGVYVNPGNTRFAEDLNSFVYVDKSEMVAEVNTLAFTNKKYLCVSRARRFGKTMMSNLLSAYYSKGCDSRALFQNLKLANHEGWDKHLNSVNVISVDLNEIYGYCSRIGKIKKTIKILNDKIVEELRSQYPTVGIKKGEDLCEAIVNIYTQTNEIFVLIIDEYDVILREEEESSTLLQDYLVFLNSLFKGNAVGNAICLAYITGILPILRDKVQSKLNNFRQFTMLNPGRFAPYFGFTEEEMEDVCAKHGISIDECREMYDGYSFPDVQHIYNPNSVVEAICNHIVCSYWTLTSASEAVTYYINANIEGMQDDIRTLIEGGQVAVDVDYYQNNVEKFATKDEVFTYLIHLGYLAYDSGAKTCRIPNKEIRQEWIRIMKNSTDFDKVREFILAGKKLIDATERADEATVAAALDEAHRRISSHLTFNLEASLQTAILQAYFYANQDYIIIPELPAGDGYADVAFIPTSYLHPAIIVELKREGDPQVAIDQIKSRNYAHVFARHPGKGVVIVGISYDKGENKHRCKIELLKEVSSIWK